VGLGGLRLAGAVGGALLGVDSIDGHVDPLPVGALGGVARVGPRARVGSVMW
jgi:hypothetical protein